MATYVKGIELVPAKIIIASSGSYTVPAGHVFVGTGYGQSAASPNNGTVAIDSQLVLSGQIAAAGVPVCGLIVAGAGSVITTNVQGRVSGILIKNTI